MRMPYFVKGMLFVGAMCVIGHVDACEPFDDVQDLIEFETQIAMDQLTMCLEGEFGGLVGDEVLVTECYVEYNEQMIIINNMK